MKRCVHFVGFKNPRTTKDQRYVRAALIFGEPDFLHPGWDLRAQREIVEGDVVLFAKGSADQEPRVMSFNDPEPV